MPFARLVLYDEKLTIDFSETLHVDSDRWGADDDEKFCGCYYGRFHHQRGWLGLRKSGSHRRSIASRINRARARGCAEKLQTLQNVGVVYVNYTDINTLIRSVNEASFLLFQAKRRKKQKRRGSFCTSSVVLP